MSKFIWFIKSNNDRILLQNALNAIHVWSRKLQLQIAIDKCLFLQVGYFDNNNSDHLHNTSLSPLSTTKDLGITLIMILKPRSMFVI